MIRLLLCLLLLSASWIGAERPDYVTVLLYHRFDEPQYPTTNTQTGMFRKQLAYLRDEGYRILSAGEFADLVEEGKPFPRKGVLITIDDAYRSVYENGLPVLREFGYPFVLFVNVSPLYSDRPAYMTWEMLEKVKRMGGAIGSHSYYHPHLGRPRKGQDRAAYGEWVRADLGKARRALEEHGVESDLLAFPFGEYNEVVVEVARELGYRLMFTQDEGAVDERTDAALIPRVAIVGANMDMERFAFKLNYAPLHVLEVEPEAGFLTANPPERFALRLAEPDRYDPGVVNMFVSEWGRVEAAYEGASGRISFAADRELTRPFNRVIVTAREREGGAFSIFSRLYFRPFEELVDAVGDGER